MKHVQDKQELFKVLQNNDAVITPNNRLANQLTIDYYNWLDKSTTAKPNCIAYSSFLTHLYHAILHSKTDANKPPVLINTSQEQFLWQQTIRHEAARQYNDGIVMEAHTAWQHCLQWNITWESAEFNNNSVTNQMFQVWCQEFQAKLDALNAITLDQVVPYITNQLHITPFKNLSWACFDAFTPQQQALQIFLDKLRCQQMQFDWHNCDGQHYQFAATDDTDEQNQLIIWLKSQLNSGKQKIGVIVPNLAEKSKSLQRLFLKHFKHSQFEFSLGQPLADFTMIHHMLSFLAIEQTTISNEITQILCTSPFIKGMNQEMHIRHQFLQTNPLMEKIKCSWHKLLKALPDEATSLKTALEAMQKYPQTADISSWAKYFKERLAVLGFPGDFSLNSHNYQLMQHIEALFSQFIQLQFIEKSLTLKDAIQALNRLAQTTIFQPQQITAPIQISGTLEASGCEFEALWFMSLDDKTLPQPVKMSPFIPKELQKKYEMPRASLSKELKLARQLINRMINSSKYTIFSFAKQIGDTPNLPSIFLEELPAYAPSVLPDINKSKNKKLSSFDDSYLLPVGNATTGNSGILTEQAKCPFRAFAKYRLNAKNVPLISIGESAKDRGILMHRVLEILMPSIGSQANLQTLDEKNRSTLIEYSIKKARPNIASLEQKRLEKILQVVLQQEETRPPFEIMEVEKEYNLQLSNMGFNVRIDRLDKNIDNSYWVIDYKTSVPSSLPWYEERPESPQLLLYALLELNISTLLYLQLKAGNVKYSGLTGESSNMKSIQSIDNNSTWDEQKKIWRKRLTSIVSEYESGHCAPKPKKATICQGCEFKPLCRIT